MTMELRQWAIEQAIAARTDCGAVTAIAAQILAFVEKPKDVVDVPVAPKRCKRLNKAVYEAAFDAGERPFDVAMRLGVTAGAVSTQYTRIRRARGILPLMNANATFGRKNGAAHS